MVNSRLFVLLNPICYSISLFCWLAPVFKVDYVLEFINKMIVKIVFRFAMEVDGIFYIAQVKQKEKAWRMYKEARARNQTAGLVDVEARHSNRWVMMEMMIDL